MEIIEGAVDFVQGVLRLILYPQYALDTMGVQHIGQQAGATQLGESLFGVFVFKYRVKNGLPFHASKGQK